MKLGNLTFGAKLHRASQLAPTTKSGTQLYVRAKAHRRDAFSRVGPGQSHNETSGKRKGKETNDH